MAYKVKFSYEDPLFIIGVAARMLNIPPQTLRYYESIGLLNPERTAGNQRVYSNKDLDRVKKIKSLTVDLGINLAGVEVVLNLLEKIEQTEATLEKLSIENLRLRKTTTTLK